MDQAGGYQDNPFTAESYDHVPGYVNRGDERFYVEEARKSGGPVLELACGTGRVLIPTAREGIEIVGIDLSKPMLDCLRSRLDHEPDEVKRHVTVMEGDIRGFDLGRKFKLITIPFRPFQHLSKLDEQLSCLRSVERHLDDDGRFILDIFNPSIPVLAQQDFITEFANEPDFAMPDGRRVQRKFRYERIDYFEQVVYCEIIYYITHPDGHTERAVHSFPMRYIFRYEAEHLLLRCGMVVEHLYAGFDRNEYGSKYPGELIFVARKAS